MCSSCFSFHFFTVSLGRCVSLGRVLLSAAVHLDDVTQTCRIRVRFFSEMESAVSALDGRYFAGRAIIARPRHKQSKVSSSSTGCWLYLTVDYIDTIVSVSTVMHCSFEALVIPGVLLACAKHLTAVFQVYGLGKLEVWIVKLPSSAGMAIFTGLSWPYISHFQLGFRVCMFLCVCFTLDSWVVSFMFLNWCNKRK